MSDYNMAHLSVHTWHRWCYKRYKKKHDKGHQLMNFHSGLKDDNVESQNQSSFWSRDTGLVFYTCQIGTLECPYMAQVVL